MKERTSGKVPMQAVINVRARTLQDFIRQHSEAGSVIHTDKFCSYLWLDSSEFAHKSANHSEKYVDGNVHVNGAENVGSLFKRGIKGVFHKVSGKYLPLCLNEVEFRYHNRDAYNMVDRVLGTSF
jgi:transposase-like protein